MPAKHVVRLLFEWGGGCLWGGNDAALDSFGVGPIEGRLPLSPQVHRRLRELSFWHDTALNWGYPSRSGPWPAEEYKRLERAALGILGVIPSELGSEFEVVYERL